MTRKLRNRKWARLSKKEKVWLRRSVAARLGHWRRIARLSPLKAMSRELLVRLEAKNALLRYLMSGEVRSSFEVLSSLRSVAAIKGNLTVRQKHGTMRPGDTERLRIMTSALKHLRAELEMAKQAEQGRAAP